jgi:hypothetical protein
MFVLKGILLGLGLFGICLAIYVVGMTRLLLKGAPTPAPGDRHWHRLRDDASEQPLRCSLRCWPASCWGFQIVGSWPTRVVS